MLDVVKELVPLLEGAKDGAIWLIAAYFAVTLVKLMMWLAFLYFVVKTAASLLRSAVDVRVDDWNIYRFDIRAKDGTKTLDCYFTTEAFRELLSTLATDRGTVHDGQIRDAIKTLKEADKED